MALILFEDEKTCRLAPAALARPAQEISCGGYRLAELLAELSLGTRHVVRPHLQKLVANDWAAQGGNKQTDDDDFDLLVNARMVPSVSSLTKLQLWIADATPGVVTCGEAVVAALVSGDSPRLPEKAGPHDVNGYVAELQLARRDIELPLLNYPHEIIKYHLECLDENLEHRIARGDYHEASERVYLAVGAQLGPYVTTDTSTGPIVLEACATIGSHSYLRGPLHIGRNAQVIDHTSIKSHVTAGEWTKLGGEISTSIIEPYSNKSHYGFLGHSYIGSWVNLGAGTTNSNMKNTYGMINVQYGDKKVDTEMQFSGCVLGDYTKTAINTSIFTGKTIGACSMLYGYVTENVPSFVNYARQFGKATEVSVDAAQLMQSRMFGRRDRKPRNCDVQLLAALHAMTADERKRFDGGLSAEPLVF